MTKTRTHVGQCGTQAFDGRCGFAGGSQYQLQADQGSRWRWVRRRLSSGGQGRLRVATALKKERR